MQALWWALGFSCLPAIERLVAIQNYVCWKLSYFFKKCLNMCEMGLQKRGTQQEFTPTLEFFFAFLQELNFFARGSTCLCPIATMHLYQC